MNMKGTGIAIVATPPRIDIAGPTPKLWNIGIAINGNPAPMRDRSNVFADTADAAYRPYVSTRKLIHCWNMTLKPAPMKAAAKTGDIPKEEVSHNLKYHLGSLVEEGDTYRIFLVLLSIQTRKGQWQKEHLLWP